jgi:sulfate adenylyltransferase
VLVHSLLGNLKPGDIPADVRSEAISALIDNYFAPNTVIQAGYPLDMRYAGPREALLHALFRQNYGCSHLIVGRDHAGVGELLRPLRRPPHFRRDCPRARWKPGDMNIDWTFWCNKCGGMARQRTCPHGEADRILLSGTKLRTMLSEGGRFRPSSAVPKCAKVLQRYYAGLPSDENVKVKLTGHSACGVPECRSVAGVWVRRESGS